MEIFKEVGLPDDVSRRFGLRQHERHARASATPAWRRNRPSPPNGAHPFSTGADQCLVHNGSLSNHNARAPRADQQGLTFQTENDTEVAAGFITANCATAARCEQAMEASSRMLSTASTPSSSAPKRLRGVARSDRLQARGDGRDRPLGRVRHRISRAGRSAGHRHRQGVGAGAGHASIAGNCIDADGRSRHDSSVRELNAALHALRPPTRNETHWRVLNPRGQHAIAVGLERRSWSRSTAMSATTAPA